MAKIEQSYELQSDHKEWIEKMAEKHNLADASKAVRCLLNYAIEDGDEDAIFGQVRCRHC